MNYGEEIAYWYLRLNGFFPITNFVIHRSSEVEYTSDCDLLAIRLPHVYEEIGGNPDDWDKELANQIGFDHIIGIICEVKTGRYEVDDIFQSQYVQYSVGRLGFMQRELIADFSEELNGKAYLETEEGHRICKLLIANDQKDSQAFFFRYLNFTEDFISDRVRKYPNEKYADRMYFGSDLFQNTIHRIHREREQRNLARRAPKAGSSVPLKTTKVR
jgi:hypothetical protein